MTKKEIIAFQEEEEIMRKFAYNLMKKYAAEKNLIEYNYDDGFYCLSNDKGKAEQMHKEWLETRVKDKNGKILKVGDVVHNKWGYDLVVNKKKIDGELWWFGMLVCEKGHSCEDIPYALEKEEIELIEL